MRVPYVSMTHILYIALGVCLHWLWTKLLARLRRREVRS